MRYTDADGMPVTVYEPNERQGGLWWGLCRAVRELSGSRYVVYYLFKRDFIAQFRQKIFGYLWALITPMMGIISFLFLFRTGVLRPGDGQMPYTLYVLLGSSIWACLPGALGAVSGGLQSQADLIMRTQVPKIALAVSSLATLCYSTLISMCTTFLVFMLYGMTPTWYFALYPLLVLPMLLLGLAAGLVLSVLGTIMRDLTPLVTQGLSLVMYVTPVIYVYDTIQGNLIKKIIDWNPLTYLVDVPRSLLVLGHARHVDLYLLVSAGVLVCVVVGFRVFYLLEDLVAERL